VVVLERESERGSGTVGPAVAIVVNDRAYLVDSGPGVVRRARRRRERIAALKAKELKIVFFTHLHSDHTLGIRPDFFTVVLGEKMRWRLTVRMG